MYLRALVAPITLELGQGRVPNRVNAGKLATLSLTQHFILRLRLGVEAQLFATGDKKHAACAWMRACAHGGACACIPCIVGLSMDGTTDFNFRNHLAIVRAGKGLQESLMPLGWRQPVGLHRAARLKVLLKWLHEKVGTVRVLI